MAENLQGIFNNQPNGITPDISRKAYYLIGFSTFYFCFT